MAGQWLVTQVENRRGVALQTAAQVVTIDLPRSNFIGAILGRLRATHGAAVTITLNRVRLIANGSTLLVDLTGEMARKVAKFETGIFPNTAGAGGTEHTLDFFLPLGRGRRDEDVILPAKAFRTLQLQLDFSADAVPTAFDVSVVAEEFVSPDPVNSKRIKRIAIVSTFAAVAANAVNRARLPIGNLLRAIYVDGDPNNIDGQPLRILVNGGSEIPFTMRTDQLQELNRQTYRFGDDALPTIGGRDMVKVDFDMVENLEHIIDTSKLNDLQVEVTASAAGQAGDTNIVTEEIIAIA